MIVTKKSLSRRTVLRGMGASLALPLLDAMVPAFAATQKSVARGVPRLAVAYVPNGIDMPNWTPAAEGPLELTPILRPLTPFRDRLTVVSGLASTPAMPIGGEGTGDHVRASAAFLTGTHPKKTEGPDIRAGVSMDQLAAGVLGKSTPLTSLELCLDSNDLLGACESGWSCAYANTLAWRTPTTPLPMENDPRLVFERLFGDVDNTTPEARRARLARNRSLLDSLLPEVERLQGRIGAGDRQKVDQFLDGVRAIEDRIQKTEAQNNLELPTLDKPMGIPGTYEEHAKLMFDLQVLAFQTDTTRVSTFLMSREVSPRTYPELGISDPGTTGSRTMATTPRRLRCWRRSTPSTSRCSRTFSNDSSRRPTATGRSSITRPSCMAAVSATATSTSIRTCRCSSPEALRARSKAAVTFAIRTRPRSRTSSSRSSTRSVYSWIGWGTAPDEWTCRRIAA